MRHLRVVLPERGPAEPDERHRLRRNAGRHVGPAEGIRAGRAREPRGRLLRHDARAHRRDREGARRREAAPLAEPVQRQRLTRPPHALHYTNSHRHDRSHDAPCRPRAVQRHVRNALHQRR
ncbi:hypothetical protein EMIT0111MI5_130163 [Burkholderia sp. IT-111MI5]